MSSLSLLVPICAFNELSIGFMHAFSEVVFIGRGYIKFILGASITMSLTIVVHCIPQCFFCRAQREDHFLIFHVMGSSASHEQMRPLNPVGTVVHLLACLLVLASRKTESNTRCLRYSFLRAAVTGYHKLSGLKQQKCILSQFWRLKV